MPAYAGMTDIQRWGLVPPLPASTRQQGAKSAHPSPPWGEGNEARPAPFQAALASGLASFAVLSPVGAINGRALA